MLKNDLWIKSMGNKLISPFTSELLREIEDKKVISYGLGSFGYDIRLSPTEFKIFRHIPGRIVDPKDFDPQFLESSKLNEDEKGKFFIIPSNSYGLGVAIERLNVPRNITVICIGKSTYARTGLICNITPAEAGWQGNLTLEFSNSSSSDIKIYANEGIAQLLFLEGEPCYTAYSDREGGGKYQNQGKEITLAKV